MVNYKLIYFDVRARGEVARMILNYANQPFEDYRVARPDWPALKPTTPFGQIPVLEVNGKQLAQSYAINRFLARKFGLAGKDDWESAQIDAIADFVKDYTVEIRPYFLVVVGFAQGDKDQLYKDTFVPAAEKFYTKLEQLLKETGSGYFAKSGPSWVDFLIAEHVYGYNNVAGDLFKNHPEILAHKDRVLGLPQLKDYVKTWKQSLV